MIANSHEELLKYYKSELTYLRRMGSVFAERYPKVAKRLEIGHDECSDPHVERLIEAFAFLTGRLQHEIDSEFPDITSALLNILYPQLTSPIPSMAIAQFNVSHAQGKLTTGFTIEPGKTTESAKTLLNVLAMSDEERHAIGRAAYARVRRSDAGPTADRIIRFLRTSVYGVRPDGQGVAQTFQ